MLKFSVSTSSLFIGKLSSAHWMSDHQAFILFTSVHIINSNRVTTLHPRLTIINLNLKYFHSHDVVAGIWYRNHVHVLSGTFNLDPCVDNPKTQGGNNITKLIEVGSRWWKPDRRITVCLTLDSQIIVIYHCIRKNQQTSVTLPQQNV